MSKEREPRTFSDSDCAFGDSYTEKLKELIKHERKFGNWQKKVSRRMIRKSLAERGLNWKRD